MSPFVPKRRTITRWALFLAGMACLMLPSLVLAQSASPYAVSNDDLSKKIFLDYLFGPLTGTGTSPLTQVVKVLNSAILFLGGVFMAYTIIAGTMSTAHDGEMLGKKWSSLWLPIRTTLGAAAVMPVIGGGWCAAQAAVVWLATLGIGIANVMWSAYATPQNMLSDSIYSPPSMNHQVYQTYKNMLLSNVCVEAYRANSSQILGQAMPWAAAALAINPTAQDAIPFTFSANGTSMSGIWYGSSAEFAANNAAQAMSTTTIIPLSVTPTCGSIIFPAAIPQVAAAQGGAAAGNDGGQWSSATGNTLLNMPAVAAQILPTQLAAINGAQAQLRTLAKSIVAGGGDPASDAVLSQQVSSILSSLVAQYSSSVGAQAKAVYSSAVNPNYIATMNKDGWVTAGAFYMEIARAQDQLTDAVTTLPTTSNSWSVKLQAAAEDAANGKTSGFWTRIWNLVTPDKVIQNMGRAMKMANSAEAQASGGVASITNASNANSSDDSMSGSWTDRFVSAFTSSRTSDGWFSGNNNDAGTGLNQNPIISAKNLGNQMINWAWTSFGVMAGIGLFTIGGAGAGTFTIIAGPFTLLFGTLLVGGASMAFYLPMLPFILWIGVVLGWAVLLIEAVIAAPLWAVVHMAPDGDGVVGRGGQGYMLILSLTLRPALMIMGLVAAISLMRPLGYLINSTFGGAFAISRGPGMGGLTAMVAGCAIYAGVMITVVNRVFSLIHVVPDRLLRWIGGGGQGELGQEAHAMDQGSAGKMVAATGAINQISGQAQNMLSGARQLNQAKKTEEMGKENKLAQERGNIGDNVSRADEASRESMGQAERGGEDAPNAEQNYAHAQSEAKMATGAAVAGAVQMAQNDVAAGKGSNGSADFLKDYEAAQSASAKGDGKAMSSFISSKAAEANNKVERGQPLQEFEKHARSAGKNQDRAQAAGAQVREAQMRQMFSANIADAKDAGGDEPSPTSGSFGRGNSSGDDDLSGDMDR